ncbi:MAG: S41 family peptidase [Planctomycetes bacterium]|nr:S41 family peptidase [Planctomycetota bacterium]
MVRRNFVGWLLPVALAAGLVIGLRVGPVAANKPDLRDRLEKVRLLHDIIIDQYVDRVPSEKVFDGAMKGMLASLDPYSEYFTQDEYSDFEVETGGEFGGLGIQVSLEDGLLTVVTPMEGTPAFRAGVQPGDKIIEIEGKSTEGMTISDAVKVLRGKPGTPVNITLFHKGGTGTEKITIVREIIKLQSIKGVRIVDEKNGVGYIRVTAFQENTVTDFDAATKSLLDQGMKALVIDLRFNGGGLLDDAIGMSDRFLSDGLIVSTRGRREKERKFMAKPGNDLPAMPLAILINESSASASEIVTGALKDHKRATVVGTRSYGKGSVQTVIPLDEEGKTGLKLTTARYFTPSGRCIDRIKLEREREKAGQPAPQAEEWGIAPDIAVEMDREQLVGLMQLWDKEEILAPVKPAGGAESAPEKQPEAAAAAPKEGEKKDEPKKPFVDVQLVRAVEVLRENLADAPKHVSDGSPAK